MNPSAAGHSALAVDEMQPALAGSRPRAGGRYATVAEIVLASLLALAVFAVHDVSYTLRQPFWLDEAWIAASTRAPLRELGLVTSSSPIGFSFVLRLVPGAGEQRYRLITLLFASAAVVAGYLLGRQVARSTSSGDERFFGVIAGCIVGGAVLLVPVMLVRDDLKSYTADAFATVLLLLLLSRLESRWTRRRLATLVSVAVVGMLFSHTIVFVSAAVLASLGLVAFVRRRWTELGELAFAGIVVLAGSTAIYLVFDKRHQISSTVDYWNAYYVPVDQGVSKVHLFLNQRWPVILPSLGTGHTVWPSLAFCVAGMITLFSLRRPALALAVPLLVAAAFTASALRMYPFLNLRTSTFWLIGVVVLMAFGMFGAVRVVARWKLAALALTLLVAVVWVGATSTYIRVHRIPLEDVRAQVKYLNAHRTPSDVVFVNFAATWGFAYYNRQLHPAFVQTPHPSLGFPDVVPVYPHAPWLVLAKGPTERALSRDLASARQHLAGHPGGRLWMVVSHAGWAEVARFKARFPAGTVRPVVPGDLGFATLLIYESPRRAA